ncbi:hypothetical protein LMH87_009390 [Akanthomyces muscarius]|uniref:Uncharacterized protein n=1 Tax=Akanthomyces muscarius TaxID=2231603 RepID=A0A9W8QB98_AKAMU|nr:hypothetical protein LMH87_009390 [Akanthomyces muscarius]KAJ4152870.1 hypothetical protein LMH87_009390 [Akanthomyces muscarius]
MLTLQLVSLMVLAGPVWSFDTAKDIATVEKVKSRVADLQKSLSLTVNKENPPYQFTDIANEPVCPTKITSCKTVYFRDMNWLDALGKVSISAQANVDADIETRHDGGAAQPDKVTTKTSTMLTSTTTKGWKVGLKLTPPGPVGGLIGGDVSGEYSEQYADAKATTVERSVEKPCPPGHRCTIQTITYQATMPGNCLSYPIIDCGGGIDPCGTFGQTPVASKYPTTDVMGAFFGPCQQFTDFANRECNRDLKATKPCEITLPILDASGKPYSHMITTQEKLDPVAARRAGGRLIVRQQGNSTEAGEPPADLIVEFLDPI